MVGLRVQTFANAIRAAHRPKVREWCRDRQAYRLLLDSFRKVLWVPLADYPPQVVLTKGLYHFKISPIP